MQQAITASPRPALCPRCGVVRRAQQTPVEADWRGVIVMLIPLVAALGAFAAASSWVTATGVLAWL